MIYSCLKTLTERKVYLYIALRCAVIHDEDSTLRKFSVPKSGLKGVIYSSLDALTERKVHLDKALCCAVMDDKGYTFRKFTVP